MHSSGRLRSKKYLFRPVDAKDAGAEEEGLVEEKEGAEEEGLVEEEGEGGGEEAEEKVMEPEKAAD